ncbi:hypothetical protein [Streptomyces sp. AC495_CC817]|uniref:hypothetical protein n=1 Tax=Streptomyces sp. AC495_CC817 TaxID=2823900 RepID=UPI001C262036|nr:hypothetical protein [Streptomyces sp. AC495_CC817]
MSSLGGTPGWTIPVGRSGEQRGNGNTATSTVDRRWGLVTATIDPDKQRTDLEYDASGGRLLRKEKGAVTPGLPLDGDRRLAPPNRL